MMPSFVLASGSSARLRLLRGAGLDPEVVVSGVEETNHDGLATAELVLALARRKAEAVAAVRAGALVLGCDSMLDLDGEAYGKPATPQDAADAWYRLAGREGTLLTGHWLITGDQHASGVGATTIRFGTPTDAEIAAYAATGEALSLAGSFSIDGRSAPFIDGIDGDASNVIGLSLPLLRRLLADLGIAITDLWRSPAGPSLLT
jgi:septum formation protein